MQVKDFIKVLWNTDVVVYRDGEHYMTVPRGSKAMNVFAYAEIERLEAIKTNNGSATLPMIKIEIGGQQ